MGEAKRRALTRAEYAVGICFPCGPTVPWQTTLSLARTVHALATLDIPVNIHAIAGSSDVVLARDAVLTRFLEVDDKFAFWIDSDIGWEPADFIRVLKLSKELGMACAAYPLKREPADCIVNFADAEPKPNALGCYELLSTGLGFTCIRRDVLDSFAATKDYMRHSGNGTMIIDAFDRRKRVDAAGVKSGVGEDCAFFDDMRALGHKLWLDPTIVLDHIGQKAYRAQLATLKGSE